MRARTAIKHMVRQPLDGFERDMYETRIRLLRDRVERLEGQLRMVARYNEKVSRARRKRLVVEDVFD